MTKEMEAQPLLLDLQVLDDQCEGHQTFPMRLFLLEMIIMGSLVLCHTTVEYKHTHTRPYQCEGHQNFQMLPFPLEMIIMCSSVTLCLDGGK
jgi:hypothetical protein